MQFSDSSSQKYPLILNKVKAIGKRVFEKSTPR
jgi:hypothetical protein